MYKIYLSSIITSINNGQYEINEHMLGHLSCHRKWLDKQ